MTQSDKLSTPYWADQLTADLELQVQEISCSLPKFQDQEKHSIHDWLSCDPGTRKDELSRSISEQHEKIVHLNSVKSHITSVLTLRQEVSGLELGLSLF
jgi:hypothetical protein